MRAPHLDFARAARYARLAPALGGYPPQAPLYWGYPPDPHHGNRVLIIL